MADKVKKIFPRLIFLICVCLVVEILCNIKVMTLDKKESGEHIITEAVSEKEGFEKKEEGYELEESTGTIKWELNDRYVDKFIYYFKSTKELMLTQIRVGYKNGFGKEEIMEINDANPQVLSTKSVVNINKNVSWITLTINKERDDEEFQILAAKIKNNVLINPLRILMTLLIGILFVTAWDSRKASRIRIEVGFALIASVAGIIMAISLPTNKVGWDEETHFKWAYEISVWPGGEMVSSQPAGQMAVTTYNWPYNQPETYEEKVELNNTLDDMYSNGDHAVPVAGRLHKMYFTGLVYQAIGIKLARGIGLPFHYMFLAGRLAGLVMYITIMSLAIYFIPIGKKCLAFIGVMPTSLFIAICYSYDTAVMAFISLGIALLLREWLDKEKENIELKNMFIAYCCLAWGTLPKAIYAPIALIGYAIPEERFKNKKQARIFKICITLLFIMLMASFIIPQLLNPGARTDARVQGTDGASQMGMIIGHVFVYAKVLLKNVWDSLGSYTIGEGTYLLMGHLEMSGYKYLIPIMAVLVIVTDQIYDNVYEINMKQKIWLSVLIMGMVAMIWTALYISFNEIGATSIQGVQGRYYHPLLILLYIVLGGRYITVNIEKRKFDYLFLVMCAIITCTTAEKVFVTFCV